MLKIFFLLIFTLIVRIFQIQVFEGPALSHAADTQRLVNMKLDKARGNILDRNDIPFTNREEKTLVIIKPLYLRDRPDDIDKICNILGLKFNNLRKDIEFKSEPIIIETDSEKAQMVKNLGVHGVSLLHTLERYSESDASHVIGYLGQSDQTGETGIEKYYEHVLKFDNESSLAVITDAKQNPLQGLGYWMLTADDRQKMLNLKLTLDYHIQKTVSEILDKYGYKGAVVIIEVNTGDIVAMVSKPDFDQNNVESFLDSTNNELFNRAVASYSPGSIFKIVIAAALYESGVSPGNYYCGGSVKLGNLEFKCSSYNNGGHGWMNLEDAFAYSCNSYFINSGIKLNSQNIINMAGKFGFGRETGVSSQGILESYGNVPFPERYFTNGDIANISIGQGEILATPLQIADMVATIANGGIKNRLNISHSIVDNYGNIVRNLCIDEGKRIISKITADRIKQLMERVTTNGTGIKANVDEYGGAGGKTGSAEAGQIINGEKIIHAWFAGYFPRENTKYSVCVFVENGKSGGDVAAPIFAEIAKEMLQKGY